MDSLEKNNVKDNDSEEYWLGELCSCNGLEYTPSVEYKHVDVLELFLNGMPIIPSLQRFPNLVRLCLMGHGIQRIENLQYIPLLEELWLCECKIKQIKGLEENRKLRKLYLYENQIETIENISHLFNLELLWLDRNKITQIEGLFNLEKLTELNLSENQITRIGNSLDDNKQLTTLNLSGNLIWSLKDLTHLCKLPNLQSLGLKDPLYAANPVALLCNYATHILYHFHNLAYLDSYDVSQKPLKDMADSIVLKKKMYYKMNTRTLERRYTEMVKQLAEEKDNLLNIPSKSLMKLSYVLKEVERELEELEKYPPPKYFTQKEELLDTAKNEDFDEHNSNTEEREAKSNQNTNDYNMDSIGDSDDEFHLSEPEEAEESLSAKQEKLRTKLKALKERITFWESNCHMFDLNFKEVCKQARTFTDGTLHRLVLELETVGNVRFEEGGIADLWYNSCRDLVMSRFSALDYKELHITSIRVHRIIRIHNRILKMKFDDKFNKLSEKNDTTVFNRDGRRALDYLFPIWDQSNSSSESLRILEEGFKEASIYQQVGSHGAVQLSNSVSVADMPRIKNVMKKRTDTDAVEKYPFRYGQLIVCKVFVGKSCQINHEKRVSQSQYPNYDSVYKTRRHAVCPTKTRNRCSSAVSDLCDCNSRRCTWNVFDHELVLPEYLVEFEYVTRVTAPLSISLRNYLISSKEGSIFERVNDFAVYDENQTKVDDEVLSLEPEMKTRPRLTVLTEDLLLKQTGVSYISRITSLNLHGSGLAKLKLLSTLTNIKKLVVSFNDLTSLQDLTGLASIEYLDASFNKITTLDGFKGCVNITYLDVSWNRLFYTREEVGLMRKYLPLLTVLNTAHNPWLKPETLRLRCIGRLRNLTVIDHQHVTDDETALALRMAACSRIAYITVLAHSRTDTENLRTLNLSSTADALMLTSKNKPVKLWEDDKQWFMKVTCLHLDNQHLSKISNLDHLENLRYASFNNNDITKIEGLDSCAQIEELSLTGNCISKLEGINHLSKLHSLDVSNNNIVSVDGTQFDKLTELRHCSIENNFITSLKSLQKGTSLCELYIGNNKISSSREIFHLKSVPHLVILDLIGNPLIEDVRSYRLFVIYHLQTLRALDGLAVDNSEGGAAKDAFGGRLTQDFIAERLGHSNFAELCELDVPSSNLRNIDLGNGEPFKYLKSVNVEHNNLTSFGGLIYLSSLKVLCLNYNHIECIVPKAKALQGNYSPLQGNKRVTDLTNSELNERPVLEKLEVLHLGFNNITNMAALQLGKLPNLKALFLQGNEIARVDGLDGLPELRELVLDKNKIKSFHDFSFGTQWKLVELHVEENRLRELSHLDSLVNLQRLYIGLNRIQDVSELEKLESLTTLIELSVIGNPVSRRLVHRPVLVFRQSNLLSIDGIPVTNEERTKAELYYLEQQGGLQLLQTLAGTADVCLPGISNNKPQTQTPLKVTQVQLNGSPPDSFYNFGHRTHTFDRLHNLSPPPLAGMDLQKSTKGRKTQHSNNNNNSPSGSKEHQNDPFRSLYKGGRR